MFNWSFWHGNIASMTKRGSKSAPRSVSFLCSDFLSSYSSGKLFCMMLLNVTLRKPIKWQLYVQWEKHIHFRLKWKFILFYFIFYDKKLIDSSRTTDSGKDCAEHIFRFLLPNKKELYGIVWNMPMQKWLLRWTDLIETVLGVTNRTVRHKGQRLPGVLL